VLDEHRHVQVPGSINRFLRDYQRDGIRFFYQRWREGRGGVLGDDMGLGMFFLFRAKRKPINLDKRKNNSSYLFPLRHYV
jgi:hypothetical protein